ncbi:hypothetical protein C3K47_09405 [Solitalea longa]|uniref:Uncharacterized protein n=1 Tax=Solitalea longa TaxID=2079460 RepID=A0A2S5A2S5_9SPHI|nr:hypothetical protein [Solitalea longa]POY36582.1 hypothetical protein C3K47_09405 [Solitalea longa]
MKRNGVIHCASFYSPTVFQSADANTARTISAVYNRPLDYDVAINWGWIGHWVLPENREITEVQYC